jgi:hypothetical protein
MQCRKRWKDVLDPNLGRANGRTGKWAEDEVANLNHTVRTHGDKSWKEVAALVPGRTKNSVAIDGRNARTLMVAQSGEKNMAL